MLPGRLQGLVEESAAHELVIHRGSLSIQPRGKDQPVTAGRCAGGNFIEQLVGVFRLCPGGELVRIKENIVPQVLEANACTVLLIGQEITPGDPGGRAPILWIRSVFLNGT